MPPANGKRRLPTARATAHHAVRTPGMDRVMDALLLQRGATNPQRAAGGRAGTIVVVAASIADGPPGPLAPGAGTGPRPWPVDTGQDKDIIDATAVAGYVSV